MSEEWDSVTKIGSKTRMGGAAPRETVVKGKSALNAAQRSGAIVATEKKFASANAVSPTPPFPSTTSYCSPTPSTPRAQTATNPPPSQIDKGGEGTRLTKVDRSDDIVAPQKLDTKVADAIRNRRAEEGFKMTQAQLAQKVNVTANDIKILESGQAVKNQQLLNKVCRVLKISSKTGEPLGDKK